jgi:hypothetical protein
MPRSDRDPLGSFQHAVYWRDRTSSAPAPAAELADRVDVAILTASARYRRAPATP